MARGYNTCSCVSTRAGERAWIWPSPLKNRSSAKRSAPGCARTCRKDIAHKVHNALHLTRDDMQRWAKILGKKGWLGYGWPKQFGGPGWTAMQKHLFEEETALAGAPRIVPFGPVMVAP
jgi:alkylation response protein AidB-like acyl-CoA dehydrogenase